jgi:hypothetical protein
MSSGILVAALVIGAATGFHVAVRTPPVQPRSCVRACAAAASTVVGKAATDAVLIKPPSDERSMLGQAAAAVKRARAEGVNRFVLRLFLPRGDGLSPPDESWQGGIMQLFSVCSPLTRELLRLLSTEIAGVPPALREQRIDASGVDGESVWFAQSSQPQDDCVAVVQPMAESLKTIRQISSDAGRRPMLLVNPQWKERDDPLDALSRKGGLLGMMGNFMGGKAAMEAELETIGFTNVYTLAEYVCRGSRICLQLSYPNGWCAFYRKPDAAQSAGFEWVPILTNKKVRPTFQEVEEALIAAEVPFKFTEFDLNSIV